MNPNQTGPQQQKPLFERLNYRAGCGALGVVMAIFGACGVVAFVSDLLTKPERDQLSAGISLSFFFACAAVAGLLIARHYFRKPPARPNVELENRLLQVAYEHRARLTVPQVALHCRVSIEESRAVLERMVTLGVAVPQVDDDGTITYFFDDLLPPPGAAKSLEEPGGAAAEDA